MEGVVLCVCHWHVAIELRWRVLCSVFVTDVLFVVQLLLSEEEVKIKTEMWMKENEDFLVLQKGSNLSLISSCTNTTQCNTTQHNTTQHDTAQHDTTQCSTAQHRTAQHKTYYNMTQYNTMLRMYFIRVHCIIIMQCTRIKYINTNNIMQHMTLHITQYITIQTVQSNRIQYNTKRYKAIQCSLCDVAAEQVIILKVPTISMM